MASLSSPLSLLFLILLLFASSLPAQSKKTQLSRRILAPTTHQELEDQPIPKPKPKKKLVAPIEEELEGDQPIPKPKPKKKLVAPIEEEVEEPIPKPKTKKKLSIDQDQDQEEDKPIPKPKAKKKLAEEEEEEQPAPKPKSKKKIAELNDDQEQPISKPKSKNPTFDSKNQTKLIKPKKSNSTSTSPSIPTLTKSKLNKTLTLKPTNSTKIPKIPIKTLNSTKPLKTLKLNTTKTQLKKTKPVNPDPIWLDDPETDSDLIAEFRDLPTRIHQALIPDLKQISITSKAYIYKANKNIADNVKPFVGKEFAPKFAVAASCIFLILPLCLVTLLFYHLNSYLSLQRFLIFVQAYLAIYFLTLALTAVVTGLEPLRFFYATSPASYAWTQAVQTLGYLLYLLVQLIHLVVVFSGGENKMGVRALGLAQMIVGLAVGCHYYAAVFHRAVTGDPPRANWKVHGVYAGCFLIICLCARAERRKKAYDGGDDCKKS